LTGQAHNLKVVGSNPTPATKLARKFKDLRAFNFCTSRQTRAVESLWNHAGGKHRETKGEPEERPATLSVIRATESDPFAEHQALDEHPPKAQLRRRHAGQADATLQLTVLPSGCRLLRSAGKAAERILVSCKAEAPWFLRGFVRGEWLSSKKAGYCWRPGRALTQCGAGP
jgi:hypothetical protein